MTPRLVLTARGPVEVAEVGHGPAVLLVHGTPGDWSQARALAVDLAERHRVLLVSRPGYGATPLSCGRTPVEQAAALAALLDALAIDRAAVVGISGGGPSARALAAHHRERVTHLQLLCAVAEHLVVLPRRMRLLAAVPALWESLAPLGARRARRALADPDAVVAASLAELGPAERDQVDDVVRADLLELAGSRARALRHVAGLRNDLRLWHRTTTAAHWPAGPDVPALVLHGDADPVVPLVHAEHHRDTVPGAVLEVLPGVGHAFPLSLRRQTARRLLDHLEAS